MTDSVIKVEHLSKQYRIGAREGYKTFRETLVDAVKAPLQGLSTVFNRRSAVGGRSSGDDTIWALKDVSFEVKQGEVVGIIGRNGAGKSTLLKILSRITEPTEGRVELRGRVGSLLEVGTGFHPELTGHENIYLYGAILGMDRWEITRKFDEIVAFAELEKFIDTPVKKYSSGMYMRLAFAVAAHLEPEILLVDEVLAVGDAAFQKKCLGKMGDVSREGRTVLFVSHNMSAILNLAPKALLLQAGSVLIEGAVESVVSFYIQSLGAEDGIDISSRSDRQGEGQVRFVHAWFEDDSGKSINHAISGQRLGIGLRYESKMGGPLRNPRVSIAVENLLGGELFVCSTELTKDQPSSLPPSGAIRCVIPELPLSQGHYHLTLFFENNRVIQDWLKSALTLDVLDGDFFGTGKQYPDGWQGKCVLVHHLWETRGI